ncbi:hypothetical protein Salmuc_02123 [Salipiger mucosus DSM 16094]|uniref:Uncharacterized protein n=1 Tax=Salipiger mucosus DSM 16094 TaxID=1123237 RepID=S9RZW4_9RHOB|nr:hypothetical protein Salmuc_02123 [Salipiger mucosus DSM 16094]
MRTVRIAQDFNATMIAILGAGYVELPGDVIGICSSVTDKRVFIRF